MANMSYSIQTLRTIQTICETGLQFGYKNCTIIAGWFNIFYMFYCKQLFEARLRNLIMIVAMYEISLQMDKRLNYLKYK